MRLAVCRPACLVNHERKKKKKNTTGALPIELWKKNPVNLFLKARKEEENLKSFPVAWDMVV
jgi:hypothetical protein